MTRVAVNRRILSWDRRETEFSDEPVINLSDDTVFEFLSEEYKAFSPVRSMDGDGEFDGEEMENHDEDGNREAEADNFWENQHQLIKSTICRTSSLESKIRDLTKESLNEARQSGNACVCSPPSDNDCRKCLMEFVCRHLQNAGFNSAICKSKWKSSPDIPSGEHTFLDVVDTSNPKKGQVRIIIELNFQAEFEMARANEDYKKLIKRLPETFVGKIERLLVLLKILSAAAKKCMKEKKMHMGPWRKHRYMQAKWLRTCERFANSKPFSSGYAVRPAGPRASMLTIDLMETLSTLHRTVELCDGVIQ